MRNPVTGLATAAPRALDSLLKSNSSQETSTQTTKGGMGGKGSKGKGKGNERNVKERTCSFDLDLSGLSGSSGLSGLSGLNGLNGGLGGLSSLGTSGTVGSVGDGVGSIVDAVDSIGEEGSVVTFEDLSSELPDLGELSLNQVQFYMGGSSDGTGMSQEWQ